MSRPNIVLVSWDSVRADHLPMYGYDRETTPYLQDVAENGVVFENAYVPGVGTPTSFGGIFTGDHVNAVHTNYDASHWRNALGGRTLLPEVLSEAGYYTGGVHANARLHREYGWNRGWDVYGDNLWTTGGDSEAGQWWSGVKKDYLLPLVQRLGVGGEAIHARNILLKHDAYTPWESLWDDIEEFVREAPEPWFLWILLVDTHHPWYPPEEYQIWDQPGFRVTHFLNYAMRYYPEYVGERRPGLVNAYDNELRHADAFLERLDGLLAETGNADAPMAVFSDHGDDLGEHGRYGHGPQMYDTVTRVPLVMRKVGQTGRVERPVTLLDLGNTLLDVADVDGDLADGHTLLGEPTRDGPAIVENFTEDDLMVGAADGEWKVCYHPEDGWTAYRRPTDRFEQTDRYGEHPEALEAAAKEHRTTRLPSHPGNERVDEDDLREVREDLTNLGYID